jgi:ubiquinone/menaquinone biosynthesis C-methylase UbiE
MSESDKVFTGAIPDIYDRFLVPLIFESYATDIARRVAAQAPASVLETAAGSGVVTRALAPLLGKEAGYVVTDLNQPMLDRAAQQQPRDDRIVWQQADALTLPFEDGSFDVVCCQFGVMFFPDRVAGYKEARRCLQPAGAFIFNTWDHIEENEFADVVTRSVSGLFPDDPPLFLARTPHGYHDPERIADDLKAAGFTEIEIETVAAESCADSALLPAIAYCQGTPLRNELEARAGPPVEDITAKAAYEISRRFGAGPVTGKIQGHVIVARN